MKTGYKSLLKLVLGVFTAFLCHQVFGQPSDFPFFITAQGTTPPSMSTGFASGVVTFKNGVITLDMTQYSVSSPINEILFQFQFSPFTGASLEWPLTGNLPASGSYDQSLGIAPMFDNDILSSLENRGTTLTIGTIDHPIVGQSAGELQGTVNTVVPEFINTMTWLAFSFGLLILLRMYRKNSSEPLTSI